MKLSLAWIFDHIAADWKKQNIDNLIARFNQVVAEIEGFQRISIDLSTFYIGKVISQDKKTVTISIPELSKEQSLPPREQNTITESKDLTNNYFLVYKKNDTYHWATCKDVSLEKDGLLPAFNIADNEIHTWRQQWQTEDVILDVDNKSITHRPDMWGHRGFAREIAAFLDLPFQPKEKFLTRHTIAQFDTKSKQSTKNPFAIEIKAPKACPRFSGLYFEDIANKPCNILIASRLINIGLRPINTLVDLTNYTMLDWSQPVHAYDATKITDKKIIIRMATKNEPITLLDGRMLKLMPKDLVIADTKKPLCLAGVMGGIDDSVSYDTKQLFFEAAHFDATSVRRTALRHHVRTDSSSRFEKTLDPNQITDAIMRFINLCNQCNIQYKTRGDIIAVGKPAQDKIITITHAYLERKAGLTFTKEQIIEPLTRLGFGIKTVDEGKNPTYEITVPTFRCTKDIEIAEDILEEIVRYYGLNNIPLTLPALTKQPSSNLKKHFLVRKVKDFLAFSAYMTEQQNHILYDESFLSQIGLTINAPTHIVNPVSETQFRLVTSLMPNLFKNIVENYSYENTLQFFEYGRTWNMVKNEIEEQITVSGIIFEKRQPVDFYKWKSVISNIFDLFGIQRNDITWKQIIKEDKERSWIMPYESAHITYDNIQIGIAGKVNPQFLVKLGALPESDAFFFELNANALLASHTHEIIYTPISKFPGTSFDLSMMIPLSLKTKEVQAALLDSSILVEKVRLIDFFEKKEWTTERSLAFRIWISNPEKTLTKEEIDTARDNAIHAVKTIGAHLRE